MENLTSQLQAKTADLQRIAQQLADAQRQLADLQWRLQEAQGQVQDLKSQLLDTTHQLREAQSQLNVTTRQLEDARSTITRLQRENAQLSDQLSQLRNELFQFNTSYTNLKERVYTGYHLVQEAKNLLDKLTLKAPPINNTITFHWTYSRWTTTGSSDYYIMSFEAPDYPAVVNITCTPSLRLQIFTEDQYAVWERDQARARPSAEGRCPFTFTPPRNGTYYVVFRNERKDPSLSITFLIEFSATWHYYEVTPPNPVRPYVNGTPGIPAREFFRLLGVYYYWLRNTDRLINETRRQLGNSSRLTTDVDALRALSLGTLLRDAGFNVSFAAVRTNYVTDWEDPFKVSTVILLVRFQSLTAPNATFWKIYNSVPRRPWVWTYQRPSTDGFEYYVLIDTSTQVYNVVYVDGVTKLP